MGINKLYVCLEVAFDPTIGYRLLEKVLNIVAAHVNMARNGGYKPENKGEIQIILVSSLFLALADLENRSLTPGERGK